MLPINAAKLLPGALANVFKSELAKLQEVQDKITTTTLGTTLLAIQVGLAFIVVTLTVFCVIAYRFYTLTLPRRLLLTLVPLGVLAVLLTFPAAIISSTVAKLESLTSQEMFQFVHVATGSAKDLSIALLALVIVSAPITCCAM